MPVQKIKFSHWFEREVRPHELALKSYLCNKVPENVDVDDILQETYKRMLAIKKEKPIRSVRGLLFAIAKNVNKDLFRKKSGSNIIAVAEFEEFDVVDNAVSPLEAVCRQDEVRILGEAIQSLPPRCRKILVLRKFEHLSTHEIAKRMNITVHTVETQLARGLIKCKKYFERKGTR